MLKMLQRNEETFLNADKEQKTQDKEEQDEKTSKEREKGTCNYQYQSSYRYKRKESTKSRWVDTLSTKGYGRRLRLKVHLYASDSRGIF